METATDEETTQTNLDVIEKMGNGFNDKDLDVIMSLFTEDAVFEDHAGDAPTGNRHVGLDAIRGVFADMIANYPGYYFKDHIPVVSGDVGALEYTIVVPGENEIRAKLCDFFEFDGGLVTRKSTWVKAVLPV